MNSINLTGVIHTNPEDVYQIKHLDNPVTLKSFSLKVLRLSNNFDFITIQYVDNLNNGSFKIGDLVNIQGSLRSYKLPEGEKRTLHIYVQAFSISHVSNLSYDNFVKLEGSLSKPPVLRETPLKRIIADVFLIVSSKNAHRSSYYIPCIIWGDAAKRISGQSVKDKIYLEGRLQSRDYTKILPDNSVITKTVHEISINKYNLLS